MAAASTSNPSFIIEVGEKYPYPSHVIAPNFVTVKLSGKNKYNVWNRQMVCLLLSHHMLGFVNGQYLSPARNRKGKVGDVDAWVASDSLVQGWILGSLSEQAADKVINFLTSKHKNTYISAKDVWDELQRNYRPSPTEEAAEEELTARQAGRVMKMSLRFEDLISEHMLKERIIPKKEKIIEFNQYMYDSILQGSIGFVHYFNNLDAHTPLEKITNNGNTMLHVAVGSSTTNHELIKKMLEMIPEENTLLDLKNSDGSTLLHVAAIVGNTKAVDILVKRNPEFLLSKDNEGHIPLALSLSNMYSETSLCMLKHIIEKGYDDLFFGKSGEELRVLAISSKDFGLSNMMDPGELATPATDTVLMALAQYFPRELNFWERRCEDFIWELQMRTEAFAYRNKTLSMFFDRLCGPWVRIRWVPSITGFYKLQIVSEHFLKMIVRPFIEDTYRTHEDAVSLLRKECSRIYRCIQSNAYHHYYTNPIFEATKQNAVEVIKEIVRRFPDAVWSSNGDGHNFIQYSVINRSEKVYSLLYKMSEHKNIYKTMKDSSGNNLLHLAARLAPKNKLNLIPGAALQIQRELQWFKEVEGFVCPLNCIQKNSEDETPELVFTREHKDLVIEGEKWLKSTAESYTITAALITTIVFAAAITVPGGNNQESGIPIFTNNITFTIFAIADAISLFTAVTSLLMFLSILTARFAEQDFLFKLPKRLIIGLTMLFLSTTAMIIAFGATLFLVFGQKKLWMLIPISALTCLPITSFMTLQFPLIADLVSSTYGRSIFVKDRYVFRPIY